MKPLFTFIAILTLSISSLSAQHSDDYRITQLIAGGGHNFQISGEASSAFADSLFSHFPETKRKGYVWKFKNIDVPGIVGPLTFQVHQGLAGLSKNGGSYFNTFTSEKYKQERLSQNISTEQNAIIIYVKRGRNYVIKTTKEARIVQDFLLSLYEK